VIGLANLNRASYQPYLDFCLAHRLVRSSTAGYKLTPRASSVLEAIDRLIARSGEVDAALLDLQRGLDAYNPAAPATKLALRYVSVVAFNEAARTPAGTSGTRPGSFLNNPSSALVPGPAPNWFQRAVPPEIPASGVIGPPRSGAASVSSGRKPRASQKSEPTTGTSTPPPTPTLARGSVNRAVIEREVGASR
jgi:hypothetical protein